MSINMPEIKNIDEQTKTVTFDDNTTLTHKGFIESFQDFLKKRIAGETLMPTDMERFMSRTSSKNLKLLMEGKKMEGYLEGSMDKMLTKGQKIAIAGFITIFMVAIIGLVIAKNAGLI